MNPPLDNRVIKIGERVLYRPPFNPLLRMDGCVKIINNNLLYEATVEWINTLF